MAQQKFALYPYQASYNNWIQLWDAGYPAGSGVPTTNPGYLGILNPGLIQNGVANYSKSLGWPTYLPFNQSRTLFFSSESDDWGTSGASFRLLYQNYWGFYIETSVELSDVGAGTWTPSDGALIGVSLYDIGSPSDTNFKSCPKFYYPNRLIDLTFETADTVPTSPLYIDFGNKGMAEFQIQDSVRYGNSNFALEILTDNPGTTPAFTTQYTVLGSNYPRFVFENNQYANPMGPLTVSDFFSNFESNPWPNLYEQTLTPQTAISWLASEDFVINGPLNENSFTNLPFDGGLLNVLVDIGNQRRNEGYDPPDTLGPDNNANLLLSLIQNGITN